MDSKDFIVTGATLLDGLGAPLDPLTAFLDVRGGRIAAVGSRSSATLATDRGEAIALPGRFVVPGLIDAHVHLELDPELRSPAAQLEVPIDRRRAAMARRAAEMLAAGITTARDCGGGFHGEHVVRDAIAAGRLRGPRLLCCGQPLTIPDGHCAFWGGAVTTRVEIDRMVALQVEAGSDWIKVMATGGVFTPGSRARDAQFDLPKLLSIVRAAHKEGRSVAAHCHGTEGIAHAVRAGVRTIEHASFAGPDGFGTAIDASLMREIAERELWVSPTVNAGWGRRIVDEEGKETPFFGRMSRLLRTQRDHGIRFVASTDAGIPGVFHDRLVPGLQAFARFAGLRPIDVLQSATAEAALALGVEGETGALEVGRSADFLVLEHDPRQDLSALDDPEYVVFRGEWLDRAARRAMVEEAKRAADAVATAS